LNIVSPLVNHSTNMISILDSRPPMWCESRRTEHIVYTLL